MYNVLSKTCLFQKDGSKRMRLNSERARYWLSVGAQPSETVAKLFERANILPAVFEFNKVNHKIVDVVVSSL